MHLPLSGPRAPRSSKFPLSRAALTLALALGLVACGDEDGDGDGDSDSDTSPAEEETLTCSGGVPGCPGSECALSGEFSVPDDFPLEQFAGVECVDGSLFIRGATDESLEALAQLERVTGDLQFLIGNSALSSLAGIRSLEFVGGDLLIANNQTLEDLSGADALLEVGGLLSLDVFGSKLGFPALTRVGQLTLDGPAVAITSGLDSLTTIDGPLQLSTPALESLDVAAQLTSVGSVTLSATLALTRIPALRGVQQIPGDVLLYETAALLDLTDFSSVTSIGGELMIGSYLARTYAFQDLHGLEALESVGALSITDINGLERLDGLDSLHTVSGDLTLARLPDLVSLAGLTSDPRVDGRAELAQLPELASLDELTIAPAGALWIHDMPALTAVQGMESATALREELLIYSCPELESVSGFANLERVDGDLAITDNPKLTSVTGFDALTEVGGALQISVLPQLTELDALAALSQVDAVELKTLPALASVTGFGALRTIAQDLTVSSTGLTEISAFAALEFTGRSIQFRENPELVDIKLPALTLVGRELDISNNAALPGPLGLDALESVGDDLAIVGNDALVDLSGAGALVKVLGKLRIDYNDALISIAELSALTSVGGDLWIRENTALATAAAEAFAAGVEIGGDTAIYGNAP